jgi:hypothetical protein
MKKGAGVALIALGVVSTLGGIIMCGLNKKPFQRSIEASRIRLRLIGAPEEDETEMLSSHAQPPVALPARQGDIVYTESVACTTV